MEKGDKNPYGIELRHRSKRQPTKREINISFAGWMDKSGAVLTPIPSTKQESARLLDCSTVGISTSTPRPRSQAILQPSVVEDAENVEPEDALVNENKINDPLAASKKSGQNKHHSVSEVSLGCQKLSKSRDHDKTLPKEAQQKLNKSSINRKTKAQASKQNVSTDDHDFIGPATPIAKVKRNVKSIRRDLRKTLNAGTQWSDQKSLKTFNRTNTPLVHIAQVHSTVISSESHAFTPPAGFQDGGQSLPMTAEQNDPAEEEPMFSDSDDESVRAEARQSPEQVFTSELDHQTEDTHEDAVSAVLEVLDKEVDASPEKRTSDEQLGDEHPQHTSHQAVVSTESDEENQDNGDEVENNALTVPSNISTEAQISASDEKDAANHSACESENEHQSPKTDAPDVSSHKSKSLMTDSQLATSSRNKSLIPPCNSDEEQPMYNHDDSYAEGSPSKNMRVNGKQGEEEVQYIPHQEPPAQSLPQTTPLTTRMQKRNVSKHKISFGNVDNVEVSPNPTSHNTDEHEDQEEQNTPTLKEQQRQTISKQKVSSNSTAPHQEEFEVLEQSSSAAGKISQPMPVVRKKPTLPSAIETEPQVVRMYCGADKKRTAASSLCDLDVILQCVEDCAIDMKNDVDSLLEQNAINSFTRKMKREFHELLEASQEVVNLKKSMTKTQRLLKGKQEELQRLQDDENKLRVSIASKRRKVSAPEDVSKDNPDIDIYVKFLEDMLQFKY